MWGDGASVVGLGGFNADLYRLWTYNKIGDMGLTISEHSLGVVLQRHV